MNLRKKKCSTKFTIENLGWFPNDYLLYVNNAKFCKDFFLHKPWSKYNIRFQIDLLRSDIHFFNLVLIFSMHIYAFNYHNLLFSMHILDVLHPMHGEPLSYLCITLLFFLPCNVCNIKHLKDQIKKPHFS